MSSTALLYGTLDPPSRQWRPASPRAWTCVGALAIPLWAMWPCLAIRTFEIPTLEFLAMMFLVGWLVLKPLHRPSHIEIEHPSTQSRMLAVAFAVSLSAGDIAFLAALHRIPAAQANLISYLWPVMIVGFGAAIGLFRLRLRHIIGLGLGFSGAVILIWDGRISMSVSGIGLALLNGACWAAYCIFRLAWKQPAGNVLARGCAISAVLCAVLHVFLEPTVIPSLGASAATAGAGVLPLALGNFVWDQGFRRGDSQLLAVMAYATPLCSAVLLAALGAALFTWNLFVGAVVIVLAGMLSRTGPSDFSRQAEPRRAPH
jgi:drug/metabolite transporter (DMT)-like permease